MPELKGCGLSARRGAKIEEKAVRNTKSHHAFDVGRWAVFRYLISAEFFAATLGGRWRSAAAVCIQIGL